MRKIFNISLLALLLMANGCGRLGDYIHSDDVDNVVAKVDDVVLTRDAVKADMPTGLSAADSATFVRMYIDNWLLTRLKMRRAEEVLSSSSKEIDRLVEGYRQSLIMRRLDQYYIDNAIDVEITDQQIAAYHRANSAAFRLDHNKLRGVVVKTPRSFRNTTTLQTALRAVPKKGVAEVAALAEKHSLQLVDMTSEWVSFSDFLSNLPTERSRSYDYLLSREGVQQMSADDAVFYLLITDIARKGEVAPLECVREDIRRRLYNERRTDVVKDYEAELKREAVLEGRIVVVDSAMMHSLSYRPADKPASVAEVKAVEESITEDDPLVGQAE